MIIACGGPSLHRGPRDLLDLLMAARDPESGAGFSPKQLRDQIATMILAGHETSAVALCWSVYLLAQLPGVQSGSPMRLRQRGQGGGTSAQQTDLHAGGAG
jgi:cytochrome P450